MNESQMAEILIKYFNAYGYYVIFLALLLENFFITGLVIPGETVLLLGSAFAAQGELSLSGVIMIAASAAIIGNIIGYFIGKHGGRPLIERFGSRFIPKERIISSEKFFDDHGPKTVFVGRFTAGVRVFVPLLAGASRMNFVKFLGYSIAAVLTWTVSLGLIGYFFGENWPLVKKYLSNISVIILVAAIAIAIYIIVRRRREKQVKRIDSTSSK